MKQCYKRKLKFAKNDDNQAGFTLLEMLLSFAVLLLIAFGLPIILQVMVNEPMQAKRMQILEWNVFLAQLKKEVRMSESIEVISNRLYLNKNGERIMYEKYTTNIRRRVNNTGHELVLQQVANVQFQPVKNGVFLTVTDSFSRVESISIRSYLQLGEENEGT